MGAEQKLNEARKPVETEYWNMACNAVAVPHGSQYDAVPENKRNVWYAVMQETYKDPVWLNPSGFEEPLVLSQVPEGLSVFLPVRSGDNNAWMELKPEETKNVPAPADPIRVRHDAYFDEVFRILRAKLGMDFTPELVPNEYCGAESEPWYKFMFGENTIIIGPRKRVVTVKVQAPSGLDTKDLNAAATAAQTTYYVNGGWQCKDPIAQTIEVHAWTKE